MKRRNFWHFCTQIFLIDQLRKENRKEYFIAKTGKFCDFLRLQLYFFHVFQQVEFIFTQLFARLSRIPSSFYDDHVWRTKSEILLSILFREMLALRASFAHFVVAALPRYSVFCHPGLMRAAVIRTSTGNLLKRPLRMLYPNCIFDVFH